MTFTVLIANFISFIAGICSVVSVWGKKKKQIVFMEFIGTILRIISNFLVRSWSDVIAKIIKAITQNFSLKNKLNKYKFYFISIIYIVLCLIITYLSRDLRCLIAIIPSIMEFYSLLVRSTKKYRWYIIITKIFWTINNIVFQLYVGIIFDLIIVMGHYYKLRSK